jgi:L-threonylcarbamoyladenylate synthase
MLKLMSMIIPFNENSSAEIIAEAIKILKKGGVVAYPTESFYALGVLATDNEAVDDLFLLKKRPVGKPLPVIVGDMVTLSSIVKTVPARAVDLMDRFWPGPLTIVFEAAAGIPDLLTAQSGKVAVRIPGAGAALDLARTAGFPITATSANISAEAPADTPDLVLGYFGDKIDLIIDGGRTPGGRPSTIVDVTVDPVKVLREGSLLLQF